mmetsp:Transcript_16745/g.33491  ORF Transcript_16745/g.33491 Transcript_16745/m.33491 type:complete len:211 (-) Transcript_16745:797-1429(-)
MRSIAWAGPNSSVVSKSRVTVSVTALVPKRWRKCMLRPLSSSILRSSDSSSLRSERGKPTAPSLNVRVASWKVMEGRKKADSSTTTCFTSLPPTAIAFSASTTSAHVSPKSGRWTPSWTRRRWVTLAIRCKAASSRTRHSPLASKRMTASSMLLRSSSATCSPTAVAISTVLPRICMAGRRRRTRTREASRRAAPSATAEGKSSAAARWR